VRSEVELTQTPVILGDFTVKAFHAPNVDLKHEFTIVEVKLLMSRILLAS